MGGVTRPTDEHGLPLRSELFMYDAPDGGVFIGIAPARPIADEIMGVPDQRVISFVHVGAAAREQLGIAFIRVGSLGTPPPDLVMPSADD